MSQQNTCMLLLNTLVLPGPLVTMESGNVEDPSCTIGEINTERSMRKRARGHVVDKLNLNLCLCGSVIDPSAEGIVKCKQTSCKTQWVSTLDMADELQLSFDSHHPVSYQMPGRGAAPLKLGL